MTHTVDSGDPDSRLRIFHREAGNVVRIASFDGKAPFLRTWPFAFVLLWAGLIFGTSCTVVSTVELFSLVRFVGGTEALRRFEIFWAVAWFAVVKGWHATEFAILTAGLVALLHLWRPARKHRNVLLAGTIAVLFAVSDEFHQTFVPTRDGTLSDVLIDSVGVGLAMLFFWSRLRPSGHDQNALAEQANPIDGEKGANGSTSTSKC